MGPGPESSAPSPLHAATRLMSEFASEPLRDSGRATESTARALPLVDSRAIAATLFDWRVNTGAGSANLASCC